MGIIATTMIAETMTTMTTRASTEEALAAAAADSDDAIDGGKASGGTKTINKWRG